MERINSPEQLNKMMRVSKARIWIVLVMLLLLITFGIYWFVNNEVVISEIHPCYISTNRTTFRQYAYDFLYAESGDEVLTQYNLDEATSYYGEESMNQEIYPAIIYVKNINETELLDMMPIQVAGLSGSVIHIPSETLDCSKLIEGADFTSAEKRKAGMDPGIDYYPILVALAADQEINVKSGLYKARVILNVLKPIDLIVG